MTKKSHWRTGSMLYSFYVHVTNLHVHVKVEHKLQISHKPPHMVSSRMWYHEHSPENIQINYIERTVDGIDTGVRRIYILERHMFVLYIFAYLFAGCFDLCAEVFY